MGGSIFIAILAVIINILLSLLMPCILKNNNSPFIVELKRIFKMNIDLIIANSIIVGLTTYIALEIAPYLQDEISVDTPTKYANISRATIFGINGTCN